MKTKNLIIVLLLAVSGLTKAQQTELFTGYLSNRVILNPAFTGVEANTSVHIMAKSYFVGFNNKAPGSQLLSIDGRKEYYGLGLMLLNDYFGNSRFTGMKLTYSYHLKVGETNNISLALSPGLLQYALNGSDYYYFDNDDPAIADAHESKIVFDADFGALYYSDNFFAGLSIHHLLQPNISVGGNDSDENRLMRSFRLCGSYNLALGEHFSLQPLLVLNMSKGETIFDIQARAHIKNLINFGLGFRSSGIFSVMAGVTYKNYLLGYSYDYATGSLSSFQGGSHEIVVGYRFGTNTSNPKM